MGAYYNEIDPGAAAWLRELIKAGLIAPGDVDTRDIRDVEPDDLIPYTQCHFFAGIGVWSYALRLAGFPDDRPVWTGSCPCQPFSNAGKRQGISDERHLWPVWARLIRECQPQTIFGEQVASNLITGSGTNPDLQRLWERKVHLGVLADWLEKDLSFVVQGVSEQDGTRISTDAKRVDSDSSVEVSSSCEVQSLREGIAVRPNGAVGASSTRPRYLRSYRNLFRLDGNSRLEQSVLRSDSSRIRLHHAEHKGHSLRPECGLRELGREQTDRNRAENTAAAARTIGEATTAIDRELEEANGLPWLDALQFDLEAMDYSLGAVPFPAAGVGAPNIRDRLYWVADRRRPGLEVIGEQSARDECTTAERSSAVGRLADDDDGRQGSGLHVRERESREAMSVFERSGEAGRMGDASGGGGSGRDAREIPGTQSSLERGVRSLVDILEPPSPARRLADADGRHACTEREQRSGEQRQQPEDSSARIVGAGIPGPVNGFWRTADWILCRDPDGPRWRPVEPGSFPLVHGAPARVGRLRGYGNAINAQAAAAFISAYLGY